jgi:hypothetical protein
VGRSSPIQLLRRPCLTRRPRDRLRCVGGSGQEHASAIEARVRGLNDEKCRARRGSRSAPSAHRPLPGGSDVATGRRRPTPRVPPPRPQALKRATVCRPSWLLGRGNVAERQGRLFDRWRAAVAPTMGGSRDEHVAPDEVPERCPKRPLGHIRMFGAVRRAFEGVVVPDQRVRAPARATEGASLRFSEDEAKHRMVRSDATEVVF